MASRNLSIELLTSLNSNDSFIYYHLVKFEKAQPSKSDGAVAGLATDFAYITDAPYNITWDDGATDAQGNALGDQIYVANKLLKVGGVQETIEARASNMSLVLSSLSLGIIAIDDASLNATSDWIRGSIDFVEAGFREGDKVLLEGSNNDGLYVRFDSFASYVGSSVDNSQVNITPIDTLSTDGSDITYTFTNASEEINAITTSQTETFYSNYINREVHIYRAHASTITGESIGDPFLLFRGIITKGDVKEDPEKTSSITWSLSSHWGDFVRIQGRSTSDSSHRALSLTGVPDRDALIRSEYATDYGFMHAEKSINVLGIYQAQELRYKTVKRGGLAGWLGGRKVKEYYETVDREVDLRFNLSAKYLPVVYGVQKVSPIPVFADIDVDDPSNLYTANTLCEGEIAGIYDIHIEDNPSVCSDQNDEDVRGVAAASVDDANVDVVCYGRSDRGDVLAGSRYVTESIDDALLFLDFAEPRYGFFLRDGARFGRRPRGPNLGTGDTTGPMGLTHEKSYTFDIPINASFIVHTGKSDQTADEILVSKAMSQGFKVQADYYEGDPSNYWSTSHTLLDTAYTVGKFILAEGEESIPQYAYVIKGKFIDCYNYDHSFAHNPNSAYNAEDPDNFDVGDLVHIQVYDGGWGTQHSNVQIIDKWVIYDNNGIASTRFRCDTDYPNDGNSLVNLDGATQVRLVHVSSADTWTMVTYDYSEQSGDIISMPLSVVASVSYSATPSLTITLADNALDADLSAISHDKAYISITDLPDFVFLIEEYNDPVLTLTPYSGAGAILEDMTITGSTKAFLNNAINISSTTGITIGDTIRVTRVIDGANVTRIKQVAAITGDTLYTEATFDKALIPGLDSDTWAAVSSPDTYDVGPGKDSRVSINPAMQILDYMTSRRYGRDLKPETDLDLDTFLESARLCDDRSKVTLVYKGIIGDLGLDLENSSPKYKVIYADSSTMFQGTVVDAAQYTYKGQEYVQIVFDDVIGKFGRKWNDYTTYKAGEFLWQWNKVINTSGGLVDETTFLAATNLDTLALTKVSGSGTGPGAIIVWVKADLGGLKNSNSMVRSWTSADEAFRSTGYTLYDSDDVKYWKYLGWDLQDQRYVTRHQMNQVIDTSTPIFDNINSMLAQFNGMLRYSNGLYALDIKTAAPPFTDTDYWVDGITKLSKNDIVGSIKVDDKGQKNSFNSISANIVDPSNKFGSREISFFNSVYLKEDKGVPKPGNFSMPGVSNYYNARTNIVQYIDESRYGLTISFKMDQKGYILVAGTVVALTYPRFSWVDKMFRITSMNLGSDSLVSIIADEHNNNAFLIEYTDRSSTDNFNEGTGNPGYMTITPPTSLEASQDFRGEIELTWLNSNTYDPIKHNIEIWVVEADVDGEGLPTPEGGPYTGNIFANATLLDTTEGTSYVHNGLGNEDLHVWFYWIRYSKPALSAYAVPRYSKYEPLSTDDGVEGQALGTSGQSALSIIMSNGVHTFPVDISGDVINYTGSGTQIWVYEGATELVYDETGTADGTWKIGIPIDTDIDVGAISISGDHALVGDHSNMIPDNATIEYPIIGTRLNGAPITVSQVQSFSSATQGEGGSDGEDAKVVKLEATAYVVVYDPPSPSEPTGVITMTPTPQNVVDPWYRWTGDNFIDQTLFSDQPSLGWPIPASYFGAGMTIKVEVSDNSIDPQAGLAFDTVTIAAVKPGVDGSAGVDGRVVSLTTTDQTFVYTTAGDIPLPDEVDITAIPLNYTGTPWFTFIVNDEATPSQHGMDPVFTYSPADDIIDMPDKIEVELREDDPGDRSSPVKARDQISMIGILFGSDALNVSLTNEAHSMPADSEGVVTSYVGSGTEIRVFEGATQLIYDGVGTTNGYWEIHTITDIDIVAPAPSNPPGDEALIGDMSAMEDTENVAKVTYEVQGYRQDGRIFNLEKSQSFSKSIEGTEGTEGTSGITVVLTNEAHTVPADENGNVTSFSGSGTIIRVFEGGTELVWTSAATPGTEEWRVDEVGTDCTPDSSPATDGNKGAIYGPLTAMDEDTAYVTFTITGKRIDGSSFTSIDKIQSFSKSIAGDSGLDVQLVRLDATSYDIKYDEDTGGTPNPSSVSVTATAQNIVNTWFDYTGIGINTTKHDGDTATTDTEAISIPSNISSWSGPRSYTVSVFEGNTGTVLGTDTITLIPLKDGSDGDPGTDGTDGTDGDSPFIFMLGMGASGAKTLSWSKSAEGVWSPTENKSWLLGSVYQDGVLLQDGGPVYQQVAVARHDTTGELTYTITVGHHDDIDITVTGNGTQAMTITWEYTPVGTTVIASMSVTVTTIIAGVVGGGLIDLEGRYIATSATDPSIPYSYFRIDTDRNLYYDNTSTTGHSYQQWLDSGESAANYEVKATVIGPVAPSSSSGTGSWLSLASDKYWIRNDTTPGDGPEDAQVCVLEIKVRHKTTFAADTCTVTLRASMGNIL